MPELPEVEVTRLRIAPLLLEREISRVVTTAPSSFFLTPPATLRRRLRGRRVLQLSRHGKYLIAELDDGSRLLLHLGMTGQLVAASASSPRLWRTTRAGRADEVGTPSPLEARHVHLSLHFGDGGEAVRFRDPRRFGKVQWLAAGTPCPRLARLGPDALLVSPAELYSRLRGRRAPIKALLLDQSLLAGVGNIYADEALFRAGLRPQRAAGGLARASLGVLVTSLHDVLHASIVLGGTSLRDFVRPDGSDGAFRPELRVYGRSGLPCSRCGTGIRRTVIAGRSTHYCPRCQR